jgi:SSS family solute:Na+ symporter
MSHVNGVALAVLVLLFALVTGMGFWASRWRRPTSMESLDEWGLGGRSFGTWITWFLLGGDLYTAYTFIAVPARCPGSSRCPTPSSCTRSSSCSWAGCGR